MTEFNAIYNANVYVNGNSQLGRASQFKLPDISVGQTETKGLGLVGSVKLPSGIEALEGEITWNSFYPDVFTKVYNPFKACQLMVRANVQAFNASGLAAEAPMVVTVMATFSKNPLGIYKPKEKAEFASTFQATEIHQTVAGREVLYYNAFTNQYRVNGVDMLAQMRANIGM